MNKEYVNMWGAVFGRPVLVDGQRWNGWAIPYFSEEDLPALIDFMNVQEFTGAPFTVESFGVRGSHTDINCCKPVVSDFLECLCVCCECVDTFEWESFEGARVVSVGGGAWCWSSSTAEEFEDSLIESAQNLAVN